MWQNFERHIITGYTIRQQAENFAFRGDSLNPLSMVRGSYTSPDSGFALALEAVYNFLPFRLTPFETYILKHINDDTHEQLLAYPTRHCTLFHSDWADRHTHICTLDCGSQQRRRGG